MSEFIMTTKTIYGRGYRCRWCTEVQQGSDHRFLRFEFFFSRRGEKEAKFKKRSAKPVISVKEAEGSTATESCLSYEVLELIRQRGAAGAAGNYQLTAELAKRCREAIKEDLKE
ncbi:hypothetical protein ANCCAN_02535 [Ancylostoma caninum]|uniref:Uncharacterized protein n=1 Tax=Ancylostoma caninum TaxID=29170 RepID=A0A368H443_ANCCA|nr:hypothetical protein ANCCAN_02535 [Ancylostoma caninum]